MTIETRSSNRANPRPKKLIVEDASPVVSDWRHRAAFRDYPDKDLWFPIGNTGPALLQIEDAKAFCRRCPAVDDCLQFALEANLEAGVYGGMSEDERRALKRRVARVRSKQGQDAA